MKRLLSTFCALALISSASGQSVPSLMNYQGRLTDEAGKPLSNGVYRLAFRLLTNTIPAANEPVIWGREYDAHLIEGVFNVVLGAAGGGPVAEPTAVNDLAFAFSEPNRYLELRVVRDATGNTVNRNILPRQQLLSSPFSLQAQQASNSDRLGGQPPSFWAPVGGIMAYGGAGTADPVGWFLCNGAAVSRQTYSNLFAVIGTSFGAGDGSTTFNLPDSRGLVLRGAGNTAILGRTKVGPALGERQEDQMQRLTGTISWHRMAHPNGPGADRTGVFTADENGASREGAAQSSTGKSRILFDSRLSRGARTSDNEEGETRVSALGVNYIIKY